MKSAAEFSPSKQHRNGLFPWCKSCKSSYQKAFINRFSKEERAAKYAAWCAKRDADEEARARFLSRTAATALKRKYGITKHQIVELASYQGEVCAICGTPPDMTRRKGPLRIDHDHKTGRVRGLLCESCNLGLGFFRDSPTRLTAAAAYLQIPPCNEVTFTEPEPKPAFPASRRNPEKWAVLELICKQCKKIFPRKAQQEYTLRAKGKDGPFCSLQCSGAWAMEERKVGLVHGTTTGYTGYKCRCLKCRRAHAKAERERLERKRKQ